MSHSVAYLIAAATLGGISITGVSVDPIVAIVIAAVGVAMIGVPHGGLDHWVGRRMLTKRLGRAWPIVFLPLYLVAAVIVAAGWLFAPVQTIVLFFLASAWHFGREDGLKHFESFAVGGLIIWVPALMRPAEMESILQNLIVGDLAFTDSTIAASQVVAFTQFLAAGLIPIAAWSLCFSGGRSHLRINIATGVLAIATPILWSFTLFFCGWHSVRGLNRMRAEENLSWQQFGIAVLPLSIAAVAMIAGIGVWFGGSILESNTLNRMLFIGLASIAVPHLFLHELENGLNAAPVPLPSSEVAHVS